VLAPNLVRHERIPEAYDGLAASNTTGAWNLKPARFRSFKDLTQSGVYGDARRASREKGEKLLAICVAGLAATLRDAGIWS
jgi:creatinine amidohydrolase